MLPNLEYPGYGHVVKQGQGKVHGIARQVKDGYDLVCGGYAMNHPAQKWKLSKASITCTHCLQQLAKKEKAYAEGET